jgi:hypothetical protein
VRPLVSYLKETIDLLDTCDSSAPVLHADREFDQGNWQ